MGGANLSAFQSSSQPRPDPPGCNPIWYPAPTHKVQKETPTSYPDPIHRHPTWHPVPMWQQRSSTATKEQKRNELAYELVSNPEPHEQQGVGIDHGAI